MNIIKLCNKVIEYSFYTLFFLVPLVFFGSTSELFELNKMWVTWGLTVGIIAAWLMKMIAEKQIRITRTPLDSFLIAFLLSQLISTFLSLDSRVSLWGYYSRFNGGFLSTLSYIILFYALISHFSSRHILRLLSISIISGIGVALWGLPSHFGYDPTCFLFRQKLDVSCWTDAFKPTIRMFSTLGQPAWLAAYMAVLVPITMATFLGNLHNKLTTKANIKYEILKSNYTKKTLQTFLYFIFTLLFYTCLLFANTRAGFLGFWIANIIFWSLLCIKKVFSTKTLLLSCCMFTISFCILNFLIGTPLAQLNKLTYQTLFSHTSPANQTTKQPASQTASYNPVITDSGDIRVHVWNGAIDAWKANPIFGTGVETFAYAYYLHRPVEHNLTSEWDYLYNKAHNEYLNYLTTTGIVGLGTYLLIIGFFIFYVTKLLFHDNLPSLLKKNNEAMKQPARNASQSVAGGWSHEPSTMLVTIGLFTGWFSILITNFLGFSVVIINLFLFLIPACVFIINHMIDPDTVFAYPRSNGVLKQPARIATQSVAGGSKNRSITITQWTSIGIIFLAACYPLYSLFHFWQADIDYALGFNLARSGEYRSAYIPLKKAYEAVPDEPVFADELSAVSSQVAFLFSQQKEANGSMAAAAEFAQQAIDLNNHVLTAHPNSIVYWKTRIRIFYTLGQLDSRYLPYALQAAEQAVKLAPTDAKVFYNLGVLYGQTGNSQKAIAILQQTTHLKPDYADAYFALGLFYHDLAVDKNGRIVKPDMQEKAIKSLDYILDHIDGNNTEVKKTLQEWQ